MVLRNLNTVMHIIIKLLVSNREYVDAEWTEKDIHVERTEPDQLLCDFIKDSLP